MDKDRLRREMEKAGLTQAELARQLRVSQPTVFAWLNGSQPRADLYERLLVVLPDLSARLEKTGVA
jgi:transcriptional regulator with XRE-family HTH domain